MQDELSQTRTQNAPLSARAAAAVPTEDALSEGERLFRDLFEHAPVGYHEVDAEGRYVRVNRTEAEMLGYEPSEMVGRFAWEFVVESISRRAFAGKIAGHVPLAAFERTFRRKDGSVVPVLMEERMIRNSEGVPCGIRTTVFDISLRKRAEEALKASEERYRRLVELSPDAVLVEDDGGITFVNDAAIRLFGAERRNELLGKSILDFVHRDSEASFQLEPATRDRVLGTPRLQEHRFTRLDGQRLDVEVVLIPFDQGRGGALQLVVRDITQRKQMERRIRELAYHDSLTGLPNRILLYDRAEVALAQARRHGASVAFLFIDLDGFKAINDGRGHAFGDRLLVKVAGRINGAVRDGDTLARLGGDEFVLLLPELQSEDDAAAVALKMLEALRGSLDVDGITLDVSASIGVSIFPRDGEEVDVLLMRADAAMYRAKTNGRDRFEIFQRGLDLSCARDPSESPES